MRPPSTAVGEPNKLTLKSVAPSPSLLSSGFWQPLSAGKSMSPSWSLSTPSRHCAVDELELDEEEEEEDEDEELELLELDSSLSCRDWQPGSWPKSTSPSPSLSCPS